MIKDFFPTPTELLNKMAEKCDLGKVKNILEPSAGRGDICDFIKDYDYLASYRKKYDLDDDVSAWRSYNYNKNTYQFDVIEIEDDLQRILNTKEHINLIHDDFLTFQTRKCYDLIVANFPFSEGEHHLWKAIDLIESSGGQLVCLVNAETIKNPYTKRRKEIVEILDLYGAEIEYIQGAFENAERKTTVEVALIDFKVERLEGESLIFNNLRESKLKETNGNIPNAIVSNNYQESAIQRFNLEADAGIKLIEEYFAMTPYMQNELPKADGSKSYSKPILELQVRGGDKTSLKATINGYLQELRFKYWEVLIKDPRFNSAFTSDILNKLSAKLTDLKNYDFTRFNIDKLYDELRSQIAEGIEKAIMDIFDDFSRKWAHNEDIHNGNCHYYNGWKTNQSWRVNEKVIIPMNGFSSYSSSKGNLDTRYIQDKFKDIIKVFNFFNEHQYPASQILAGEVDQANQAQKFQLDMRYFTATFYKKGTVHLKFTNKDVLDKFNIYASGRKNWLPPRYGKVSYQEMSKEERETVDTFQGKDEYTKVFNNPTKWIIAPQQLQLTD